MYIITKIIPLLSILLIMAGCKGPAAEKENIVYVSIAPLKYIVEQIADTTVTVRVLVPETTSPETYEPTFHQIKELSGASAYIAIGLIDFERSLCQSVMALSSSIRYLDLSQGIATLESSHEHEHDHTAEVNAEGGGHSHSPDPHTWLSPRLVKNMASQIAMLLAGIDPRYETLYAVRLEDFMGRVDSLDRHIRESFATVGVRSFAIAHPSLTYYAHDYGLRQIPVEAEGKEPSVQKMKEIVDELKEEQINTVIYQRQTNGASAETVAREISGTVVEFDPLAENWLENMYYITGALSRSMR